MRLNDHPHSAMSKSEAPRRDQAISGSAPLDVVDLLVNLSKQGNRHLRDGALAQAEKIFQEILELEPGNSYALVGLAQVAKRQGELAKAIDFYQKCLQLAPYNSVAMLGLADCYRASNQLAKALALWEKHLELHGKDTAVLTRMADAYRRTKRVEKAKQAYAAALANNPNSAYALIGLGYLHYELQDYPQALKAWLQAHALDATQADVRLLTNLGNCHRKLKSFDQGVPYFQRALELDQGNFFALFGLADCYRGVHRPDQSLLYWEKILARDPANKIVLTRAGDALRQLGQIDAAQARYLAALQIGFDCFAAMGLATVLKIQGHYREALSQLQSVLTDDPANPRLQQLVVDCQQRIDANK